MSQDFLLSACLFNFKISLFHNCSGFKSVGVPKIWVTVHKQLQSFIFALTSCYLF